MKILLTKKLNDMKHRYEKVMVSTVFQNPLTNIQTKQQLLDSDIKNLSYAIEKIYNDNKSKFVELASILDSISPLKTLQRGYTVTQTLDGKVIKTSQELNKDDKIYIQFTDNKRLVQVLD